MQDIAAVGCGGGSRFGPPVLETNKAHPQNTNDDGANVSGTPLLRRVVKAATTQIGGPASGGLVLVNLGMNIAVAGLQATGKVSIGEVTLISSLIYNMGMPATTTQVVQLPLTPQT